MQRSPWGRRASPPSSVRQAIENAMAGFAFADSPAAMALGCCLGEILFWGLLVLLYALFGR